MERNRLNSAHDADDILFIRFKLLIGQTMDLGAPAEPDMGWWGRGG